MAQTPDRLQDVVLLFLDLIHTALPVLAALALLLFIWGLIKFIYKSGDEKSHTDGRKFMIWGVIALFVLVSFMGIIRLFFNDLGFNNTRYGLSPFGLPYLPIKGTQ
ncbi:hypothetical protein KW785_00145 [Candidatus Parcubacteria bacterium]|nr:hypothetical protein [Candidatus Parcubacteria bacterium]